MSGKGRTRRDVGGRASRSVRSRRIRNVDLVGRGLAKTVRAAQIPERCLGVSPSLSLSKSDAVHMSWGGGAGVGRGRSALTVSSVRATMQSVEQVCSAAAMEISASRPKAIADRGPAWEVG